MCTYKFCICSKYINKLERMYSIIELNCTICEQQKHTPTHTHIYTHTRTCKSNGFKLVLTDTHFLDNENCNIIELTP